MARAAAAYSSTLSGPYCQPSPQSPPTNTPAGCPTAAWLPASPSPISNVPNTSSSVSVHSESPLAPFSPLMAIAASVFPMT